MNLKQIVGMNLKYYRYKNNKSQEKYYEALKLNPKYLASMERGEINFSVEYLEEIATSMGVTVNDLILYDETHIITKKRIDEKLPLKEVQK